MQTGSLETGLYRNSQLGSERESEKANSSGKALQPIISVASPTLNNERNEMDNVKLTLPNGTKVEAAYMSVTEAQALDSTRPVANEVLRATLREAVAVLGQTNMIMAIRLARAVLGVGLKEAKPFVEEARDALVADAWKLEGFLATCRAAISDEEARERKRLAAQGDIPF